MATYPSILAWKIPWTEDWWLQYMGIQEPDVTKQSSTDTEVLLFTCYILTVCVCVCDINKEKFAAYVCQSPAPAARESAWRDEQCRQRMMQPLTQGEGLHVYFKLQVLFYTLTKALGQRFDIFSSLSPRFIISLLPLKQSSCFSNSLRIMFTYAYVWAAYHIPQFISYVSKSCLPLVS